jgi:2-polyprenyl-6-methoxyphenol hydroxylase-like FAD-dependent oxidoreductase
MAMKNSDVLIIGAGPTGLVLALWLTKFGIKVRLIDKTAQPGTTSRALAVQARTLELYRQLDLTDEILKRAHQVGAVNLWVQGKRAAQVSFENIGSDLTPYPFLLIFPQDEHERLLVSRLESCGVSVERETELLGFVDHGHSITARLRRQDRTEEAHEARFIAGCDGARSTVRETIGAGFPGGTYRQLFYVADVAADGPAIDGNLNVDLDEADFLGVFPLAKTERVRLIGTVRDERADDPERLRFEDVSNRAIESLKVSIRQVNWFSTYHVHHRVTEHFRKGRAFLLGDAAHIHSPAGGQGMNTGIGDAINLAWKFASVLVGRAPDALLDSYESERIGFARRLVATTDQVFSFATADGSIAEILRTRIAPILIPRIVGVRAAREFLFRTVAQITLNYRGGPLSAGRAGRIHGGDRLPWVGKQGTDNYAALADPVWQVHVYGPPSVELTTWCTAQDLPLHVFPFDPAHESAGLATDALYLIRPDSYVALADPSASVEGLQQYAAQHLSNAGQQNGLFRPLNTQPPV